MQKIRKNLWAEEILKEFFFCAVEIDLLVQ